MFVKYFFRVTVENKEELKQKGDEITEELKKILQIYGLITGRHAEIPTDWSGTTINSDQPFGEPKIRLISSSIQIVNEEQKKHYTLLLNRTIEKFKFIETIFEDPRKSYLRNAIDYFHRALSGSRLEEQLIDLMISLESLFSREYQELRLRYSLRTSFLLGVGQEGEKSNIFRTIYNLYDKRSKVVHGTEAVDLNIKEIWAFQKYLKEAIKRFIHIEMPKEDLLKLLDGSVYDKEKMAQLNEVVLKAIEKW